MTQIHGRQIKDNTITNSKQNFGTPSAAGDVVIKSYLESELTNALGATNLKDAVRVATTAAGTLATSFAN